MIYHLIKFEKLSAGIFFDPAGHIRVLKSPYIKKFFFCSAKEKKFGRKFATLKSHLTELKSLRNLLHRTPSENKKKVKKVFFSKDQFNRTNQTQTNKKQSSFFF